MRLLIAVPLLALAACQISKDSQNDTISAEFNADVAENGLEDAANLAENVGEAIANDVEETADKVGNTDIDVDIKDEGNKAN